MGDDESIENKGNLVTHKLQISNWNLLRQNCFFYWSTV